MTKLQDSINMLEDYIENLKPDNRNHLYADKEAVMTLISDIKKSLPEDLELIPKLLEDAKLTREQSRDEARKFLEDAKIKRDEMIDASSQVQMANEKAQAIVHEATNKADQIVKEGQKEVLKIYEQALNYYISTVKDVQTQLAGIVGSITPMYNNFFSKSEDTYRRLDAQKKEKEDNLTSIKSQIALMEQMVMQNEQVPFQNQNKEE